MPFPSRGLQIPFTVGLAGLIYAAFLLAAWNISGCRCPDNLESAAFCVVFYLAPLCAVIGLFARRRWGWYFGVMLPACYLVLALLFSQLAAHGIFYDRWYANGTQEYIFCGRDGMTMLAAMTGWSAILLVPAALLLFSPTARVLHRA